MPLCALLLPLLVRGVPPSLVDLGKKYGVEIEVASGAFTKEGYHYTLSGTAPTDAEMEKYATLFVKEWSLYPPSLMKKAKVVRIFFCDGLKVGDQIRAACPSFDMDTMFYDPALGSYNSGFQRSVIHHEFFHMIDERMGLMNPDREWSDLNPSTFKYGDGGKNMRTAGVGKLTSDIPGFLTLYGTSAVEEDKAELFAHLIVDPSFVSDRIAKDSVVSTKAVLLKKRLAGFDPAMGDSFWGQIKG